MPYRGWCINTLACHAGYAAQYTSPAGRTYQTSPYFKTADQATANAQAVVDHLLVVEKLARKKVVQATMPA
jgi:hypothetical protein